MSDQFRNGRPDDDTFEEVELMTRLIVAAAESADRLAQRDIDRILGL